MFFSNANRALVKAEVPGLDFGGIARELTRRWAELPDADKKPFLDLADQDKRRCANVYVCVCVSV